MRAIGALSLVAALTPALNGPAHAHAFLQRATPLVGSAVPTPPQELVLEFTEEIEPRFSRVEVLDSHNEPVDAGEQHLAPNDAKRLIVKLKPLKPGVYKVKWHVLSVDTHRTDGSFTFSVQP